MVANKNIGINFANLSEKWDFFPLSCTNGYYFLWNVRLPAPPVGESRKRPIDLLKKTIQRAKRQTHR